MKRAKLKQAALDDQTKEETRDQRASADHQGSNFIREKLKSCEV